MLRNLERWSLQASISGAAIFQCGLYGFSWVFSLRSGAVVGWKKNKIWSLSQKSGQITNYNSLTWIKGIFWRNSFTDYINHHLGWPTSSLPRKILLVKFSWRMHLEGVENCFIKQPTIMFNYYTVTYRKFFQPEKGLRIIWRKYDQCNWPWPGHMWVQQNTSTKRVSCCLW